MNIDYCDVASLIDVRQFPEFCKFQSTGYIKDIDLLISEVQKGIESLEDLRHALNERDSLRWDSENYYLMASWCNNYKNGHRAINPEKYISFVCDSIDKLRRHDIERLLTQFEHWTDINQMAIWLLEQRPDLEEDIDKEMELLRDI